MERFRNHELEYVDDEFSDFENYDGLMGSGSVSVDGECMDSDLEDDFEMRKPKTDTSASEVRNGKDMQGIPWERLNCTREEYRESRLKQYKNYENLSSSGEDVDKNCKEVEKGHSFYDFQFNTRLVKSTIVHFQLRNLLWSTSKHDVYLTQNYSVMHWSSTRKKGTEVLNVAKPISPALKYPGCVAHPLSRVQISTMTVKDGLIVAGGFQGEFMCKNINQPGVAFCTKLSDDENAITNAVDIYYDASGAMRVMTANNDAQVRVMDSTNFACLNRFTFPWSVNNTSVSPSGRILAVLGDSPDCLIADAQSGKVLGTLCGHLDYSFASAWHPDGWILATGNQDKTCRLWDIRNLSESLDILKGRMGAIRTIKKSISLGRSLEFPSALIPRHCLLEWRTGDMGACWSSTADVTITTRTAYFRQQSRSSASAAALFWSVETESI